jgi:hypothetical protein
MVTCAKEAPEAARTASATRVLLNVYVQSAAKYCEGVHTVLPSCECKKLYVFRCTTFTSNLQQVRVNFASRQCRLHYGARTDKRRTSALQVANIQVAFCGVQLYAVRMFAIFPHSNNDAANDNSVRRDRTVPIPSTITAVPGYPNKLAVFKIAASKYWQARCWIAGRTHRRTTKTTSLMQAQRFARWFYESLLVSHNAADASTVRSRTPVAALSQTAVSNTTQTLTFGALAAQVYANEQARADRGEFGKGSLRMLRNRLDAHILPRFGMLQPAGITYQLLLEFSQYLSAANSSTTVSHYIIIVRKILVHAVSVGALETLPEVPKIKVRTSSRGAFTPSEYWTIIRTARKLRGIKHPDSTTALRKQYKLQKNRNVMPPDVAWAIGFMVNSFIRPGDLKKLKHKHVEVVRSKNTYLRLTLPETKLHNAPIVTLQPAVRIYQQICKHQSPHNLANANDYLFLPDIKDRQYAMSILSSMFNWVLDSTGLKQNANGKPRSLYSLRHSSITFRLLYGSGIDLVTLARNARTGIDVINNHYASTVTGEQNIAMLQSRRTHTS